MGDKGTMKKGSSDQSKPFNQIIESPSNLPCVIKYDTTQEVDPHVIGPKFDPAQSYLLHAPHEIKRILARSATFQSASRSFDDCGQDVAVDEHYDGWFAVFGNPSDHRCDPVVPHFRSIGKLSISPCETFLVSGRLPLDGMKVIRSVDGSKTLEPFEIQPGAVLTKVGMYTVSLKIKTKKSVFKSKVVSKDETYMACRDELQNEMLIPCHANGTFYVISQVSGQLKTPIMKIGEIINRHSFPVLVKLVHGRAFEMPSACKGTLVLLKSQDTKIAFASTLYSPQPAIIEIAADTSLRFYNFDATKVLDLESNNNSTAFSKAYKTYSDQMPFLLQTIRFRNNDTGLASARSSSTSGHGSELSDDEDKYDWSNITLCSNAPFIDSISTQGDANVLFTHHVNTLPTPFQTQLSSDKDKKSKSLPKLKKQRSKDKEKTVTVATTFKKTTMYDSPKQIPETIQISQKRRASRDSNNSVASSGVFYENSPTSPISPTVTSPFPSETDATPYGVLWSDSSSVISDESLEVVVEGVTHTDVSGHSQDASSAHEYKNLSSELAATVRIRNKSRKSLDSILNTNNETEEPTEEVGNEYEVLSDYRNTVRGSYHKLLLPTAGMPITASVYSGSSRNHQSTPNNEEGATGTQSTDNIQQNVYNRVISTYHYEEPNPNYSNYERPDSSHYDRPQSGTHKIIRTRTYEIPRSLNDSTPKDETETAKYNAPKTGPYVMPSPNNNYEMNISEEAQDNYQDDGIEYENVDPIYESIADLESQHYANMPKQSDYLNFNQVREYVSGSLTTDIYQNSPSSTLTKPSNNNGLYLNAPSTNENNDNIYSSYLFSSLISNLKSLGLKPATEEAIKIMDSQKFESCFGEEADLRSGLEELLPHINRIDLNKISLFLNKK